MNRLHTDRLHRLWIALVCAALLVPTPSRASDHADPMNVLNPFFVQPAPEANITDLHAFITDATGKRQVDGERFAAENPIREDYRLVISLCVRRAIRPSDKIEDLKLKAYTFRVHLDLDPPVRFVPGWERNNEDILEGKTGDELVALQRDLSMQRLYGGVITRPEDIADTAVLEFALELGESGGQPIVTFTKDGFHASGLLASEYEIVPPAGPVALTPGKISIAARVSDDPFIFPRFFRRNVVALVASIPLGKLPVKLPTKEALAKRAPGDRPLPIPILLWATTHKGGQQIDHVGRSLRTQLPRFGYLNDKHPADHVRAITRVHAEPTIVEETLVTFIGPLEAHRHYDSVPDVMVYDLARPAKFPNGRAFEDDVAKTLADAGETLLLELSYAESKEFPRATRNDKTFREQFPYLAPKWEQAEVAEEDKRPEAVPRAPDMAATAFPTFHITIWRRFFWSEVVSIVLLAVGVSLTVRSRPLRAVVIAVSIAMLVLLDAVYADNLKPPAAGVMEQPSIKATRLLVGAAWILFLGLGEIFALGRRSSAPSSGAAPGSPPDRQDPIPGDSHIASYDEIRNALFDSSQSPPYYRVWAGPGNSALPIYRSTFRSAAAGAFSSREFAILRAARRTLSTRADLRWGPDRKGFQRLVHPMGVCLEGKWKIDADSPKTQYTGYFAPNKEGRVIARYSLGGNHAEGGNYRSLGLVGKVFPREDAKQGATPRAHFITQEDLGGTYTDSITEAILTNSPPVTLQNRRSGLFAFLPVIVGLAQADAQISERQLYEIAELEKPEGEATICPRFMRLTISRRSLSPGGERIDFRDELLGMIYDPGDPHWKRDLIFTIEVSDRGRRTLFQRVVEQEWVPIGEIAFREAAASYNGDFVVHFHHPVWRTDRNDPGSVQRANLREQ